MVGRDRNVDILSSFVCHSVLTSASIFFKISYVS
jgi:hypothetical protein